MPVRFPTLGGGRWKEGIPDVREASTRFAQQHVVVTLRRFPWKTGTTRHPVYAKLFFGDAK